MIQHSASGNGTKSGEVSDSAWSMPAAAMLDARARMFTAQTLSRAASLRLRLRLKLRLRLRLRLGLRLGLAAAALASASLAAASLAASSLP